MIIKNKRVKGLQAYKQKRINDYLIVDGLSNRIKDGMVFYEAIASQIAENPSSIAITTVSEDFLADSCRPLSWKKIPEDWQNCFLEKITLPETKISKRTKQEQEFEKKQLKLF